jgi:serine/threonine-protein kinase
MSSAPEPLPPGTLLANKLRIVRRLGVGGMGAVYEIEHELTKHRRALKVLHRDVIALRGAVERFLREASAAGRIHDPHIVETFDAGTLEGGEPYVVLELLEGETLAARIAREGKLDLDTTLEIVAQACEGVEAAHAAGIVHRDLKPDNLFLVPRKVGPPFVKILDFGISKFEPERTGAAKLTGEGAALGTPLYMSPEQVRAQGDVDGRADVYALGVILYESVAGAPPFDAASLHHLMVLIHDGRVTPLGERRPGLPSAFYQLVAQAMAVEREQRYPSARALRDALRAVQASLLDPNAFADTAPELGSGPAPAPDTPPSAAPATTTPPPRPNPEAPAPSPSVPPSPAVVAGPAAAAPHRARPVAMLAAAAVLFAVALIAVSRFLLAPAASLPSLQVSSEPRPPVAPSVVPVEQVPPPRVEPAPPPTATASAPAPFPSSRPERPAGKPSTRTGQGRADQAGLAKSPFP